jgi:hypothetical protein
LVPLLRPGQAIQETLGGVIHEGQRERDPHQSDRWGLRIGVRRKPEGSVAGHGEPAGN